MAVPVSALSGSAHKTVFMAKSPPLVTEDVPGTTAKLSAEPPIVTAETAGLSVSPQLATPTTIRFPFVVDLGKVRLSAVRDAARPSTACTTIGVCPAEGMEVTPMTSRYSSNLDG